MYIMKYIWHLNAETQSEFNFRILLRGGGGGGGGGMLSTQILGGGYISGKNQQSVCICTPI